MSAQQHDLTIVHRGDERTSSCSCGQPLEAFPADWEALRHVYAWEAHRDLVFAGPRAQ